MKTIDKILKKLGLVYFGSDKPSTLINREMCSEIDAVKKQNKDDFEILEQMSKSSIPEISRLEKKYEQISEEISVKFGVVDMVMEAVHCTSRTLGEAHEKLHGKVALLERKQEEAYNSALIQGKSLDDARLRIDELEDQVDELEAQIDDEKPEPVSKKPTIRIKPRNLVYEERIFNIRSAMRIYESESMTYPESWNDEIEELQALLKKPVDKVEVKGKTKVTCKQCISGNVFTCCNCKDTSVEKWHDYCPCCGSELDHGGIK